MSFKGNFLVFLILKNLSLLSNYHHIDYTIIIIVTKCNVYPLSSNFMHSNFARAIVVFIHINLFYCTLHLQIPQRNEDYQSDMGFIWLSCHSKQQQRQKIKHPYFHLLWYKYSDHGTLTWGHVHLFTFCCQILLSRDHMSKQDI